MILLVDLDGVICTEEKTFERSMAKPLAGAREALAALKEAGHTIVIYSARSWAEFKMTEKWLRDHEIPYDGIHLGKPLADRIIDDRAIAFRDWGDVLKQTRAVEQYPYGLTDEVLLRALREETKDFLTRIAARGDLVGPVLDVGPMSLAGKSGGVFERMPETFVDSRQLFRSRGIEYQSIDPDPSCKPDVVGDVLNAESLLGRHSIGTILMMSCLEHVSRVWEVPRVLRAILKEGGRVFALTPWNLRIHGPRPDCWRISDDGYAALFADGFQIESLEKIECPGRPLSPIGIKCILVRR